MNNIFTAFKIEVKGQFLDDKEISQYPDFDISKEGVVSEDESVKKAEGFIRMNHFKRSLSKYNTPTYIELKATTEGTVKTVPTDMTIVVGFINDEPFKTMISEIKKDTPKEDADKFIAKFIQEYMIEEMNHELKETAFYIQEQERKNVLDGTKSKLLAYTYKEFTVPAQKLDITVTKVDMLK